MTGAKYRRTRDSVAEVIHQHIDTAETFEEIADDILKKIGLGPGFDDAVDWLIERLSRYEKLAPDHFSHICEGRGDSCGCPFAGE